MTSYWHREAGWGDRYRDTPLPARVDFAVIGGGLAGLATAIRLRERRPDARIVVLEAERVGFGASGRNAGLLSPLAAPVWLLAAEHAWAAAYLHDAMHATAQWLGAHVTGSELTPARLGIVAAGRLGTSALGEFTQAVARVGLPHRVAARTARAGHCLELAAYTVHPYALVRGLAEHAVRSGVTICEGARVRRLDGARIALANGRTLDAARTVVCTNAYTPALALDEPVRALVVHSYMAASAPLDPVPPQRLQRDADFVVEVNVAQAYHRMHGRRVLYGGVDGVREPAYDFQVAERVRAQLGRGMQASFPQVRVPIDTAWSGRFHATPTGLPIVRHASRHRGIVLNVGYGGTGVTLALVCARLAAGLACDDLDADSDDARLFAIIRDTRIALRDAARAIGGIVGRLALPWRT